MVLQVTALARPSPALAAGSVRRSAFLGPPAVQPRCARHVVRVFGGPEGTEQRRKVLKREDEPEEYWSSANERKGSNPFKDPLAQIGILAIFFPFLLLGLFIALGLVDLSGGR